MTDDKKKKELTEEELKKAAGGRVSRDLHRPDFEEGTRNDDDKPSDREADA